MLEGSTRELADYKINSTLLVDLVWLYYAMYTAGGANLVGWEVGCEVLLFPGKTSTRGGGSNGFGEFRSVYFREMDDWVICVLTRYMNLISELEGSLEVLLSFLIRLRLVSRSEFGREVSLLGFTLVQ